MRRRIQDWNFNGDNLGSELTLGGINAALLKTGIVPAANTLMTWKHSAGPVNKTVLTFAAQTLSFLRTSNVIASGSLEIFDFPEGWIRIESVVVQGLTVGLTATDSINFVASVGTVAAAADATLTATEVDMVASTALTLTSNVATFNGAPIASVNFDGSSAAKKAFMNFASSGDIVSTRNITLTGTIILRWSYLGDY